MEKRFSVRKDSNGKDGIWDNLKGRFVVSGVMVLISSTHSVYYIENGVRKVFDCLEGQTLVSTQEETHSARETKKIESKYKNPSPIIPNSENPANSLLNIPNDFANKDFEK